MSLLTEQEIKDLLIPLFIRQDQASIHWPDIFEEVALIESAVIEKIKAQGPVGYGLFVDGKRVSIGQYRSSMSIGKKQVRSQPLYHLPEGD